MSPFVIWINVVSILLLYDFFFKQKTAYEVRISDWSSDVCSSDLVLQELDRELEQAAHSLGASPATTFRRVVFPNILDRKSVVEGKSVSVRVDLGGRRLSKTKTTT